MSEQLARRVAAGKSLPVQSEEEVHRNWAGETYRVTKRIDNPKSSRYGPHMKQAVISEVEKGTPPSEAALKYGVCRATVYRLLKRG